MTWTPIYRLTCDVCGASRIRNDSNSVPSGWLCEVWFYGSHDLCPDCKDKPRPDWWPNALEVATEPPGG